MRRHAAAEGAQKPVRSVNRQIVSALTVLPDIPRVGQGLARLHRVGPRPSEVLPERTWKQAPAWPVLAKSMRNAPFAKSAVRRHAARRAARARAAARVPALAAPGRRRRRDVVRVPRVVGRHVSRGVRQRNPRALGVAKSNAEVRSPQTARRHGVMFVSIRSGVLAAEALLDEADQRGVVEHLRVDPAALAPRRDDDHRHAHAQAVGAGGVARRCRRRSRWWSSTVDRPCARDCGGVGGTMWSKKPSFSS